MPRILNWIQVWALTRPLQMFPLKPCCSRSGPSTETWTWIHIFGRLKQVSLKIIPSPHSSVQYPTPIKKNICTAGCCYHHVLGYSHIAFYHHFLRLFCHNLWHRFWNGAVVFFTYNGIFIGQGCVCAQFTMIFPAAVRLFTTWPQNLVECKARVSVAWA